VFVVAVQFTGVCDGGCTVVEVALWIISVRGGCTVYCVCDGGCTVVEVALWIISVRGGCTVYWCL
jgi:hypothetical protein